MVQTSESESRKLLGALRDAMAEDSAGQARLDKIVQLTASSMRFTGLLNLPLSRSRHIGALRHGGLERRGGSPDPHAHWRRAGGPCGAL